jgi:hypothetical protein
MVGAATRSQVVKLQFEPGRVGGSGVVHVWLTVEDPALPHGFYKLPMRVPRTRHVKLRVEGGLPDLSGLFPWERELLLPHVEELLANLFEPEQTREEGEHENAAP